MTIFLRLKELLRHVLFLFFNQTKTATERHRLLMKLMNNIHHQLKYVAKKIGIGCSYLIFFIIVHFYDLLI